MKKWLPSKLNYRIQVRQAVQTPNDSTGGFYRSYNTLATIWADFKPLSQYRLQAIYIRGVQTGNNPTHTFKIRKSAVDFLNTQVGLDFGSSFDSIRDENPIKSQFYFFVQGGSGLYAFSTAFSTAFRFYQGKGRLFRVGAVINVDEENRVLDVEGIKIEEEGTGYKA